VEQGSEYRSGRAHVGLLCVGCLLCGGGFGRQRADRRCPVAKVCLVRSISPICGTSIRIGRSAQRDCWEDENRARRVARQHGARGCGMRRTDHGCLPGSGRASRTCRRSRSRPKTRSPRMGNRREKTVRIRLNASGRHLQIGHPTLSLRLVARQAEGGMTTVVSHRVIRLRAADTARPRR